MPIVPHVLAAGLHLPRVRTIFNRFATNSASAQP
jgi:hypothetical protein